MIPFFAGIGIGKMGNPAAGEVLTLPPTQKERSGGPLDILGGTAV